jgi:hypothetical protein
MVAYYSKTLAIILGLLMISFGQTNAQICELSVTAADQQDYNDMAYGFFLGLYNNPPTPCSVCTTYANLTGLIQVNFIALEN